ncbi:hypothetical protein V7S43_005106 [Phytophthora oleae]|uniref:TKL protein kinase n=1 Tax=Phytophthora oleae TaxID=2107226 RepID=A0ABD3FTF8_9STRA
MVNATMYSLSVSYAGTDCDGTPYHIFISESTTCISDEYCLADSNAGSGHLSSLKTVCTTDFMQSVEESFSGSPYLLKLSCGDFGIGEVFFATGNCEVSEGSSAIAIATLSANGSASLETFSDSLCSDADASYTIDRNTLSSHKCDDNDCYWYSSDVAIANSSTQETDTSTFVSAAPVIELSPVDSGLNTAAIIGIGVGSVMVVILLFQTILCCRRRAVEKPIESHLQPLASLDSSQGAVYIQHREATGL